MAAIEEAADCVENFDESTMDSFGEAFDADLNELAIDNSADLNRYPNEYQKEQIIRMVICWLPCTQK